MKNTSTTKPEGLTSAQFNEALTAPISIKFEGRRAAYIRFAAFTDGITPEALVSNLVDSLAKDDLSGMGEDMPAWFDEEGATGK